jgi:hypothetical protein
LERQGSLFAVDDEPSVVAAEKEKEGKEGRSS